MREHVTALASGSDSVFSVQRAKPPPVVREREGERERGGGIHATPARKSIYTSVVVGHSMKGAEPLFNLSSWRFERVRKRPIGKGRLSECMRLKHFINFPLRLKNLGEIYHR